MCSIGNEHFKSWLKKLDHGTRVKKMSAIAKTQESNGLKGSLIMTSLAQLSQKCQVMLIRLTDREIKHYTRRKPVKRLNTCEGKSNYIKIQKKSSKDGEQQVNLESEMSQLLNTGSYSNTRVVNEECAISFSPGKALNDCAATSTNTLLVKPKISKAKKRRIRELFGDDLDDLTESTQGSNNLGVNSNDSEKITTNYINTVNVNIYNSPYDSHNNKPEVVIKKKSKSENNAIHIKKVRNKKMKTHVSNPDNDKYKKNQTLDVLFQLKDVFCKEIETLKKKSKSSSRNRETHKHKKRQHDKDSSIQQMWSKLGMEAPIDRSENIKSRPSSIANEKSNKDFPLTQPNIEAVEEVSAVQKYSLSNNKIVSEELQPIFKIAKPFRLADFPVEEADPFKKTFVTSCQEKENGDGVNINIEEERIIDREQCKNNDTICIDSSPISDDSNSQSSDKTKSSKTEENTKIGTIRVKSLGQLMNPELAQLLHKPVQAPIENSEDDNLIVTDSNDSEQSSSVDNDIQHEEVKKRFFLTYNYYFDVNVESAIPILGEILHLAIADLIRKEERIKRAEQLSSDDLINDEKQRAEKDFNDMMKTRGNEFSPLLGNILKKFDEKSKKSLFVTLFCRLLKHAEEMDSSNKNYTLRARHVIKVMLFKHQFNDKDVTEKLMMDHEQFQSQVDTINDFLFNCPDTHKSSTEIPTKKIQDVNNVSARLSSPVLIRSEGRSTTSDVISSMNVKLVPLSSIPSNPSTEGARNICLSRTLISPNDLTMRSTIPQISLRTSNLNNQSTLAIANSLPDITITTKHQERITTNNTQSGQTTDSGLLQLPVQNKTDYTLITSNNTGAKGPPPQYSDNSKRHERTSTNSTQLHQITNSGSSQPSAQNYTNLNLATCNNTGVKDLPPQYSDNLKRHERTVTNNTQLHQIANSGSSQPLLPNNTNLNLAPSNNTGVKGLPPQYANNVILRESTTTNNILLRQIISPVTSQPSVKNSANVSSIMSSNASLNKLVPQYGDNSKNLRYTANVSKGHLSTHNSNLKSNPSSTNGILKKNLINAPIYRANLYARPCKPGIELNVMNQSFNEMPNSITTPFVNKLAPTSGKTVNTPRVIAYTTTTPNITPGSTSALGVSKPQSQQCNQQVKPDDTSLSLRHLLVDPVTQVSLPSSSHCHPFVNRMPISGKLKMLFDSIP